jgi:hypothetical protein
MPLRRVNARSDYDAAVALNGPAPRPTTPCRCYGSITGRWWTGRRRKIAEEKGAAFGWHRVTLPQLGTALAAPLLAKRRLVPISRLGAEAIVARVVTIAPAATTRPFTTLNDNAHSAVAEPASSQSEIATHG